jgi:hypothetical protein
MKPTSQWFFTLTAQNLVEPEDKALSWFPTSNRELLKLPTG